MSHGRPAARLHQEGAVRLRAARDWLAIGTDRVPRRERHASPLPTRATAAGTRRSTSATSASSSSTPPTRARPGRTGPSRPTRRGRRSPPATASRRTPATLKLIWALEARAATAAGPALGRHRSRRAVPLRRRRPDVGTGPRACGTDPERTKWFGGGAELAGHPLRSASIRATRRSSASPSRAAASGARPTTAQTWEVIGDGHVRRVHAAGAAGRPGDPGPAPDGPVPGRPGPAVGPAPQRRLPLDRRRRGRGNRSPDVKPSGFGFGVAVHPRDRQDRVVRPGGQGREAHPGGRQAGRDPDTRRRQDVRRALGRAAAGARLRPGVPPRPGRGRHRRPAGDRLHDRRAVGVGGPGRPLDSRCRRRLPPVHAVRFA